MPDPTQTPPFMATAQLDDAGVVIDFTGNANQRWIDEQNAAGVRVVAVPDDWPVMLGDTYDEAMGKFLRPQPSGAA